MHLQRPQIIVRSAAVITALLAFLALIVIAYHASRAVNYREMAACALFAVLPFMFIWASIQAWRFVPKGIVSIYSGYLLFGFLGLAASCLHWSWSKDLQDVTNAVFSLIAFAIGILVVLQKGKFGEDVSLQNH